MSNQFSEIFNELLPVIKAYSPPMVVVKESDKGYELWTGKPVTIMGREYPSIMFAALLIQKNFVGFHFFPIYTNNDLKDKLPENLLKKLKGKTCFHIKKSEPGLAKDLDKTLKLGLSCYKKMKWV